MKNIYRKIIIISSVIILLIVSMTYKHFWQRATYTLPPNISLAIFGNNPEEFFETYRTYYDYVEDFRKHARIDKEGNLILRLTKKQEEGLLQFYSGSIDAAKEMGIEIAQDNSYFIISASSENIEEKMYYFPLLTIDEMAIRQLLSKKDPKTISVTAIVKNEKTGEIVYTATWPQESIRLSFDKEDFS